jgi:hypothetical protein
MGDVLKANFNPNLHLNEINPDLNIYQEVDKTDLIVNSTEFCFTPMGTFEIESIGYVLRPTSGSDSLTAANNHIVSTKKISTLVKVFDAEYVGLQSQLYPGDFGARTSALATNNNRAVESGPEPDNGPQPAECSWDGYLSLPTLGSVWSDANTSFQKPKGEMWTAAPSTVNPYTGATALSAGNTNRSPKYAEMIRAHFTLDHVATYHAGGNGDLLPIGPRDMPGSGSAYNSEVVGYFITPYTAGIAAAESFALSLAPGDIPGHATYEVIGSYYATKTTYELRQTATGALVGTVTYTYTIEKSKFVSWTDLQTRCENAVAGAPDPIPGYYRGAKTGHTWGFLIEVVGKTPIAVKDPGLNFPDIPELASNIAGPYSPPMSVMTSPTGRYRLARTFSWSKIPPTSETVPTETPPSGYPYGPEDLRIDGAYVDTHSAFGYNLLNTRFSTYAVTAFWYKPSWRPESGTRIRTIISLVDYKQTHTQQGYGYGALSYPLPFNLFWLPSYMSGEESHIPMYGEPGRVCGFIYGMGADRVHLQNTLGGGLGSLSPTLNHEFEPWYAHGDNEDWDRFTGGAPAANHPKPNELRHHEWHHIVISSAPGLGFQPKDMDQPWSGGGTLPVKKLIYINGRELANTDQIVIHLEDGPDNYSTIHGDSIRLGGEYSMVGVKDSMGNVKCGNAYDAAPRMYYGDGTFDELYFWRDGDYRVQATDIYKFNGRYYKVDDSDPADGIFTSALLTIPRMSRDLPTGSTVSSPPSTETGTIPGSPGVPDRRRRIIAVAWTALAEEYDAETEPDGTPRLKPVMLDYQPMITFGTPTRLSPTATADPNGCTYRTVAQVSLVVNGATVKTYGPYHNEGWSAIKEGHDVGSLPTIQGLPVRLEDSDTVQFRVKMRAGNLGPGAILQMTPYFDDITIYYDHSRIEYLYYSEVQLDQ